MNGSGIESLYFCGLGMMLSHWGCELIFTGVNVSGMRSLYFGGLSDASTPRVLFFSQAGMALG